MRLAGLWGIYRINDLSIRIPRYRYSRESSYLLDEFRLPVPGFEWLPVPSFTSYWIVFDLGLLLLALLFTVGLFTRVVAPLLAAVFLYWTLLSQFFYYHHMATFLVVFVVMAFSDCGQFYSLDSLLKAKKADRSDKSILPIRQLQVFVTLLYLFSLLAKLNQGWFSGLVLESMSLIGAIKGIFAPTIFSIVSFQVASWFTILSEFFLVFGLWFSSLRPFALLVGLFLHIGIDATMGVATFSYQMFALYLVFLWPKARSTSFYFLESSRYGIYFARLGRLLDWIFRIQWKAVSSSGEVGEVVNAREFESRKIAVSTPEGSVRYGLYAVAETLYRLPLTFPLGVSLLAWCKLLALVRGVR